MLIVVSKNQNNWCVYRHVTPSGKSYFGITKQPPAKRWQNGRGYKRNHFSNAIKKYGWKSIRHYTLSLRNNKLKWLPYQEGSSMEVTNCFSEHDAKNLERLFIDKHKTFLPAFGYNRTLGGEAEIPSQEVRKQMSETQSRRWANEVFRRRMTGRNSPSWKGYDKAIFSLLDEQHNLTLEELANSAGCCETTAFHFRKEWFDLHPEFQIKFDRSGCSNPNYRGLDKEVFNYLDLYPKATGPQIMAAVRCDESTAIKYRKQWRKAKGIKSIQERIDEMLDANPELMLKDLMLAIPCSETTASKYRKRWQEAHPEIESRRDQRGKHNPKYKGVDEKIYAYLEQHPDASLKEIMNGASCSERSATKYRKAWKSSEAN